MKAVCLDGKIIQITPKVEISDNVCIVSIGKENDFSNIDYIDFEYESNLSKDGDDGYFVLPNAVGTEGGLIFFNAKADMEYGLGPHIMPIFGVKTAHKSFLAIITGMVYDCTLICGVKNGKYYVYPRFKLLGNAPYEDITVRYHYLGKDNNDYCAMAKEYRNYQLNRGACLPIKTRVKDNKILDYAKDAPIIRIRMGWKPSPSPVLEQTIQNEPPMYVACDFERVSKLLDEMKANGVEKAEICLVGWNVKGHDGRWPDAFPVEELLGGEEKLKELIKKAESYGYLMDCHTNSTDAYSISSMFSKEDLIIRSNGEVSANVCWSGGQMYDLCPKIGYEQAKEILPKVRNLGFKGLHYIDVMTLVAPRCCASKKHPVTRGESVVLNQKIMELSKDLFGGFSSEGVIDYGAGFLDFGLYVAFREDTPEIYDKTIPLFEIVYHGIIMSNPTPTTINYPIKPIEKRLKVIEHGGRPTIYIHSKFRTMKNVGDGGNWIGVEDVYCRNDEETKEAAKVIAAAYNDYKELSFLQSEFIENYTEISKDVYETTYSDGSIIRVDYNNGTYELVRRT